MLVDTKDVNWMKVIEDLKEAMTYREIAEKVGCSLSTLHALGAGMTVEPRYALGRVLLRTHQKEMDKRKLTRGRKPKK